MLKKWFVSIPPFIWVAKYSNYIIPLKHSLQCKYMLVFLTKQFKYKNINEVLFYLSKEKAQQNLI